MASLAPAATLQRMCSCGEHTVGGEACDQCKKQKTQLQRNSVAAMEPGAAPDVVHDVLRSPGEALDSGTRTAMKTHFGQDFTQVRVHSDRKAGKSAQAVGARAYTVGQHIVFAPGHYQPHTSAGCHLLRHELAHTLQQSTQLAPGGRPLAIGPPTDPSEIEAEQMAVGVGPSVGEGRRPLTSGEMVRRAPDKEEATGSTGPGNTPPVAGPVSGLREWAFGIELGQVTNYTSGYGDAHLDRGPLRGTPQGSKDPTPCELEIQLKLRFEFHLGASPYRLGPNGSMTAPGPPWPQGRSDKWKRDYMSVVQGMWKTRWPLVPANPCSGEPCKRANGHLQIIDVDTMTNAQGDQRRQVGDPSPTLPHVTMQVYEFRPKFGKDESRASTGTATLYDEDVHPQNAPQPKGFDSDQYTWRPGAASHETGHMLGRPHVSCPPGTPGDPNRDECYGAMGSSERQNVMGRGQDFRREDQAPFLAAMSAITNCEWKTSTGGLPGWAVALIVLGSLALVGGAIAAGVALSQHH